MEVSPLPDDYLTAIERLQDVITRADCGDAVAQDMVKKALGALDMHHALNEAVGYMDFWQSMVQPESVLGRNIPVAKAKCNFALAKAENLGRIERNRVLLRDAGLPDAEVERYCGVVA